MSNIPADLEWLARNVEEFPDYAEVMRYSKESDQMFYSSNSFRFPEFTYYTKPQYLQARQLLGLESPEVTEAEEEAWKAMESRQADMVNHPPHYQSDNGIECIDAIRAALGKEGFIAYCRGNAIKYQWRMKSNPAEDQGKAAWYANKAREALEE